MYRITKQQKGNYANLLLKQPESVLHTQDIAVLWGMKKPATLYTTIGRYVKRGILTPLTKGMYTTVRPRELDPLLVGLKSLHGYGYVSCETVLFKEGVINQPPQEITLVGSGSRHWTISEHRFRSRKLKEAFLYHPIGIIEKNGIRFATRERAVADLLYFHPHAPLDAPVYWQRVQDIQRAIGYHLTPDRYASSSPN